MNPVLMVAFNNREMTEKAVESVFAQDIPVSLHLVNNGSTDDTVAWLETLSAPAPHWMRVTTNPVNCAPVSVANDMMDILFRNNKYLLGVPNDVILPSNCYSEMLKWPRGFVCASDNGRNLPEVIPATAVSENTPMAIMLTRKWAYQAVVEKFGHFFDDQFFHYASDCDLALRIAACGIRGVQLNTPFWHYSSASYRTLPLFEAKEACAQADADRAYFKKKWGFTVDSLEYGKRPADPNFRG